MSKSTKSESKKRSTQVSPRYVHIKENFPRIFSECMGIVTMACKKAGIDDVTYYNWRNGDPEFAAACDRAYERAGDFVESKLYSLIEEKNPAATIFYCKTKLRKRGYTEYKEIDDDQIARVTGHVLAINERVEEVLTKGAKSDSEGVQSK